jgi:hypothetical protein
MIGLIFNLNNYQLLNIRHFLYELKLITSVYLYKEIMSYSFSDLKILTHEEHQCTADFYFVYGC